MTSVAKKKPSARKKAQVVSIAIPVYNEAENIAVLYDHLKLVLEKLPFTFEIIFVDDGSSDGTYVAIQKLQAQDRRVKAISFSRNFGHQAALTAGLQYATGDAVITMDGDLQHPPSLIPEMIDRWQEGFEIVSTIRNETAGVSRLKLATAKWFYRLINWIGNISLPPNSSDFRLLARPVVDELNRLGERALFLRGLVQWIGFRQTSIQYDAFERFAGKTKYTWRAMIRLAADGITSFSNFPLILSMYLGSVVSTLSFLYALFVIYQKLFTNDLIQGWATLLAAILFLGGIQLITIGIVGIYLGKLFTEVKKRPRFVIRQRIGLSTSADQD